MTKSGEMIKSNRWVLIHNLSFLLLLSLHLISPPISASEIHPLAPVDTSSPRATLFGFLREVDRAWEIFRGQYWHSPSEELSQEIANTAARAMRTLDLSEVVPSARTEAGYDAGNFLYETLARIELPPVAEVPDAAAFSGSKDGAEWTIPNTEITISRVESGPRKGEFLFSAETVSRTEEFYQKTRRLPYRRDIPVKHTNEMAQIAPGWWLSMSTIDELPGWLKIAFLEQAVWKWISFLGLLLLVFIAAFLVHRVTEAKVHENTIGDYLRRLILPTFLLLIIPPVSDVAINQIDLLGSVSRVVLLTSKAAVYLLATWIVWLGSHVLAESFVSSKKMLAGSIDSQLIRLVMRLLATILSITILVVGAQQLGIPAYSVIAGLGVGGIAVALAAKDSLANLLGSLVIMFEKPFRVGHWIRVDNIEGFVESIGFRSTRIRTFYNSLVSIPNNNLVNSTVDNMALRKLRAVRTVLYISNVTPSDKLEQFVEAIKQLIEASPYTYKKWYRIRFDDFGRYDLQILVNFLLEVSDNQIEQAERQRILLEILKLAETMGIQFVMPPSLPPVEIPLAQDP